MPSAIFQPTSESSRARNRVALLDVGRSGHERPGYDENQYNLALGYLGRALVADGYQVMILQQDPLREPIADCFGRVADFAPAFVGFTCTSCNYDATVVAKVQLAPLLGSEVVFLVGGVHASTATSECARDFDYVVVGEGERTLCELLAFLQQDSTSDPSGIKGLAYSVDGKVIATGRRPRMTAEQLDSLRPPLRLNFDLERSGAIPPLPDNLTGFAPISFSRGCAHACRFCTNEAVYGSGREARVSGDPSLVVDEMEEIWRSSGVNYFWTHDEDFLAYDHLAELTHQLVRRRETGRIGSVYFGGMGGVTALWDRGEVRRDLINDLAMAGCSMIGIGLERATTSSLRSLAKGFSIEQARQVVEALFRVGIAPVGLFMFGFPDEDEQRLDQLVAYAQSLPCIRYRFAPICPLPGTHFRAEIDATNGWLHERFRANEFTRTDVPILRTRLASTPEEPGYAKLVHFETNAFSRIYGSEAYGQRVRTFVAETGDRFRRFFDVTWRDYVQGPSVGATAQW
jgi:radical SAM superfamily enzyme YgiQ (UPF0313 family)